MSGLTHGRKPDVTGFGIEQRDLPPSTAGRIDPRAWFDQAGNRFEIEIGVGKGTFLVQQAPLNPETNYVGIEWTAEYYRFAADRMRRRQMHNVRVLYADATEFLTHWCADSVAAVIHLYFSDPWPKTKHHKRRVLRDDTIPVFHRVLQAGGELRLVTDHDDLWAWYEDHAARHAALFDRRPFQPPTESEVVGTNYERKFAREGRPFHAMTLVKRD